MIEQNARRALAMADRGYVLEGGQNRFEGPGPALLADAQVAELLSGRAGAGAAEAAPARAVSPPSRGMPSVLEMPLPAALRTSCLQAA